MARNTPTAPRLGLTAEVKRILHANTDRHNYYDVLMIALRDPYPKHWGDVVDLANAVHGMPMAFLVTFIRWLYENLAAAHAGGCVDPDGIVEIVALLPGRRLEGYSRRLDPRQLSTSMRLQRNYSLVSALARDNCITGKDVDVFLSERVMVAADRTLLKSMLQSSGLTAQGRFRREAFLRFLEQYGMPLNTDYTLDLPRLVRERLSVIRGPKDSGTVVALPRRPEIVTVRDAPTMEGPELAVTAQTMEIVQGMRRVLRLLVEHYGWPHPNRLPARLAIAVTGVIGKQNPQVLLSSLRGESEETRLAANLGRARISDAGSSVWELIPRTLVDNGRGGHKHGRVDEARALGIIEEFFARQSFEEAKADVMSANLGQQKPAEKPTTLRQLKTRLNEVRTGIAIHSLMLHHFTAEEQEVLAQIATLGAGNNKKETG